MSHQPMSQLPSWRDDLFAMATWFAVCPAYRDPPPWPKSPRMPVKGRVPTIRDDCATGI